MKVGVISDTHGQLGPEAIAALQGCEQIIHAGDIGAPEILEQLAHIAPVHAVRGNNDQDGAWAQQVPEHLNIDVSGWQTLLVHDIADVPALLEPRTRLVITGHSHKPLIEWRGATLYVNPGSAGRRRFKLPVTLVVLEIVEASIEARLISLLD